MTAKKLISIEKVFLATGLALLLLAGSAFADDECAGCHASLSKGLNMHQALSMGCKTCHSGIDAARTPHKVTNRNAKGLASKQHELCYGCHDRTQFEKKTVHGAIVLGCTSCHNPHASKGEKLLVSTVTELCYSCHEPNSISMKNEAHSQIAGVSCSNCHESHASDTPLLLHAEVYKTYFVMKK